MLSVGTWECVLMEIMQWERGDMDAFIEKIVLKVTFCSMRCTVAIHLTATGTDILLVSVHSYLLVSYQKILLIN